MTLQKPRILSPSFEEALLRGTLSPILELIKQDRDLIAEIRDNYLDIYCKGQRLLSIKQQGSDSYRFISHGKFWPEQKGTFQDAKRVTEFRKVDIPKIKQNVAEHRSKGKEIEFEQMLIRALSREKLNADYVAIDRQHTTESRRGQTDIVGVFWPNHRSSRLKPAIIEVKYALNGRVEGLADQVKSYFDYVSRDPSQFASALQEQLRQKARLGLIPGLSAGALAKIKRLPISTSIDDVRMVIALVDYNPKSTKLSRKKLRELPFAKQIDLFYLGFAMWHQNAFRL
jgi:hypothetical protein